MGFNCNEVLLYIRNRRLPKFTNHKGRTRMSDYCEARISYEILAGFWKIGGFPKP